VRERLHELRGRFGECQHQQNIFESDERKCPAGCASTSDAGCVNLADVLSSCAASLTLVVAIALACSSKSTVQQSSVDSGTGGTGASGGSGGSSAGGSGGTAACSAGERACIDGQPHACNASGVLEPTAPCAGATAFCLDGLCVACLPDTRRCEGTTPQACDGTGKWVSEPSCGGATPICNFASGTCTNTQVTGGLVDVRKSPSASGVGLREAGFVQGKRTCGGGVCVSGGISP